ncbi:hypothetical protein [Priestia aryabhattai]
MTATIEKAHKRLTYKRWTKEEEEKLLSLYGTKPINNIARSLNRDTCSVLNKIKRMKLPASNEYQGLININQFRKIIGVHSSTILRWEEKNNFPIKRVVTTLSRTYLLIDTDEFWEWAEKHKELIDFYKIKPQILLPEPDWFVIEREKDKIKGPKRKFFTPQEDEMLLHLFYGKSYPTKSLAKMLDRTPSSISNRIHKLSKLEQNRTCC